MHRHTPWYAFLCLAVSLLTPLTRAAEGSATTDPLRLVPDQADFVLKVEQPEQVIAMAVRTVTMKELQGFRGYREYYDSTNYRRFQQLMTYFEKELGRPWQEIVDQLAGGGIALAVKFEKQPAPTLIILQGKDAEFTKKFTRLALTIAEQEVARQDGKQQLVKGAHKGIETVQLGDQFHAAVLGPALVYSNVRRGLEAAIDLHLEPDKKTLARLDGIGQAKKLLPANAPAWAWLNLETVKKQEEINNLFELPNNFAPFHVVFGGLLDAMRRSPFLCAALHQNGNETSLSVRFPVGREGVHEAVSGHIPPASQPGTLPLLEPKGTLFSGSYYLDLNRFWEQRAKLLPKDQLKGLEEFEKKSGRFLFGTRLSQLLSSAGTYQRVVVARQYDTGYKVEPNAQFPAFALVLQLREPDKFAKAIEPPLRSLGLLAGFAAELRIVEEEHAGLKIIGYRYPDEEKYKGPISGGNVSPLNFSPCFVRVRDQFVFSSTMELARNLIDEIQKQPTATQQPDAVTLRSRFQWLGLASFLEVIRDQLVAQTILNDGIAPDEAGKQVDLLLELLRKLGSVETKVSFQPEQAHYDFRILPGAK